MIILFAHEEDEDAQAFVPRLQKQPHKPLSASHCVRRCGTQMQHVHLAYKRIGIAIFCGAAGQHDEDEAQCTAGFYVRKSTKLYKT